MIELAHETGPYGFPVSGFSNVNVQSPIWTTDMHFCLKHPQYMSSNSDGSGETALMRKLVLAFAVCLCDKYPFLMCWLNYVI